MRKASLLSVVALALAIVAGAVSTVFTSSPTRADMPAPVLSVEIPAAQPSFLTWKDERGQMHYTDSIEQVPQAYRAQVEEQLWAKVQMDADLRWTVSENHPRTKRRVAADPGQGPDAAESCGTPYHTEIEWLQFGEYTRRYLTHYDSCGNLIEATFGAGLHDYYSGRLRGGMYPPRVK